MIHFSKIHEIGEPLWAVQPQDACFGREFGCNVMYTTTGGNEAVFNIYNLDRRELVTTHVLKGTGKVWKHVMDSRGRVYMIGSPCLYRYDPRNAAVVNLGKYSESESHSFTMTIDEQDKIYIGTYPNAKVICYDANLERFSDLGTVDPDASYVRSIAVHRGFLYAGTFGTPPGRLMRLDLGDVSQRTVFEIPENPEYYDVKKIRFLYGMNMAGDILVIYCPMNDERKMILFDTVKGEFIQDFSFCGEYSGYETSPLLDGRSYFLSEGRLWYLDTKTARCVKTEIRIDEDLPFYGCGLLELTGYEGFEGISLATIDIHKGGPLFINPTSGKSMLWEDIGLAGAKLSIQAIEAGSGNHLYLAGIGAPKNAKYNFETKCGELFTAGQIEGIIEYRGKIYLGAYTGARLICYDPELPDRLGENPKQIGKIEPYQDRPFALAAGDGMLFVGTTAVYGRLPGALSIYDIEKQTLYTDYNIVQNQGIMGLTYRQGLLYASTTVYGGLGASPSEKQAKVFVYDPVQRRKLAEYAPQFKEELQPLYIGGLGFDAKGRLWGASGYTLFQLNQDNGTVERELSIGKYDYEPNIHQWRQTYIRFDERGYLYVNLNGLKAVNTEDMSYFSLTKQDTPLYALGTDQNIYFTYDECSKLYQIEIGD